MEAVSVILEDGHQIVRLPKGIHLPPKVFVRQEGDSVVLEPTRASTWPDGFFESIHISNPAFGRAEQGQLPPIKDL